MMYKNSVKLVFSKFNIVWKLIIYFFAVTAICCGINYLANIVVDNHKIFTDIISQIPVVFKSFANSFDLTKLLLEIERIISTIFSIIVVNFADIWLNLVVFVIVAVIIPHILTNFYSMASSHVMNFYMGSCVNFSFTASLCMDFWKNIRYQLASIITILPLRLVTYYLLVKSFLLFASESIIVTILAPFIIIASYVLISALRTTLFSGWVPYMVVKNSGVFEGLIKGFGCIRKRLPQIFANSIGLVLTNIILTMFGLLTFGISLIITIPACYLFVSTFNMVSFYTATGLRYYVDNSNVFAPKKTELVESYKIYKNII